MSLRFVIIGGGPAGTQAATVAARLGAEVTLIERDIVGGAAHLWDCVPSKAMIATGAAFGDIGVASQMGLAANTAEVDLESLSTRIGGIVDRLEKSGRHLLESQGVRIIMGSGRLIDAHTVAVDTGTGTEEIPADYILVSTGSRPRIPEFASPDGDRILTTRDAYPPKELPEHLVIVGSGVTGVEFVHMFQSFGSKVTLIVSRQQVLPQKDPEVAAVLEDVFIERGVKLLKGARATGLERTEAGVKVLCDDGRSAEGSHVLLAIGSIPNSEGLGLEAHANHEAQGLPEVREGEILFQRIAFHRPAGRHNPPPPARSCPCCRAVWLPHPGPLSRSAAPPSPAAPRCRCARRLHPPWAGARPPERSGRGRACRAGRLPVADKPPRRCPGG